MSVTQKDGGTGPLVFVTVKHEIHAGLGEKDEAIAWLEKGYEERGFQMQFLKLDPRWDSLRDDPRFVDLVKRIGLPA